MRHPLPWFLLAGLALAGCDGCERASIVADAAAGDAAAHDAAARDTTATDSAGQDTTAPDASAGRDALLVDGPRLDGSPVDVAGGDSGVTDATPADHRADGPSPSDRGPGEGPLADRPVPDLGADGGAPGACGAIVTFAHGLAPQRELHVTTTGSDQDGDGSAGAPYASIARAAQAATPGTAIRVHAGTYAGNTSIADLQGTAAAPIWLGGMPGEARPVLEGGSQALHLTRARYVVVHDLEARGATANGFNLDDGGEYADPLAAHHVELRGLFIHDVGGDGNQDCLKLSGLNDLWVLDSSFARCGGNLSGSGIDCVGCHRGLFARNRFEQMSGNAVQLKGGTSDVEVRWSWILDPGERGVNMGGSTGDAYFRPPLSSVDDNAEARRIRVIANVIRGGTAALAFVGCVDCLAAHNTIVDPGRWVLRILQETSSHDGFVFEAARNGRVINNLVFYDRALLSTAVNVGAGTEPASFVFANNLWYAHDQPTNSTPSLPVVESDGVVGQDPLLQDVAGLDLTLPPGSPAASAGLALADIAGDLAGRCYATPPSIGAYQAD